jgi:hypothetical protein
MSSSAPGGAARPLAYAFYATSDTYAMAVMVFAHLLRRCGVRADADLVVLHAGVSRGLVGRMQRMGLVTRAVAGPAIAGHRYYRDCLVKLRVFELTEYGRVIYADADAFPLASLDGLFELPLDGCVAAPRADWLPDQPVWGSYLMVIEPSRAAAERVARHLPLTADGRHFDMDVFNAAFRGAIATLPDGIVRLNSEWEDARRPAAPREPVALIHFTALGKPWSRTPERARRLRPHAYPLFHEIWERWWAARDEVLAGAPLVERSRLRWLPRLRPSAGWR